MAYEYTLAVRCAGGELVELSHDTDNIVIEQVEGLDPPKNDIGTAYNPAGGSTFRSAHVQERNIVLRLAIVGNAETQRLRLYKLFKAELPLTIYFTDGIRDVKITGYVETFELDICAKPERAAVSVICPSPWLESANSTDFVPSYNVPMFAAPFSIEEDDPVPISEVADHPTALIANTGDAECGMIITADFSGAVTGLKITNETTGDFFGLSSTFASGDKLTIDTRQGKLSVFKTSGGTTTSLLANITSGSKWIKLPVGVNRIGVTADSGVDNATVTLTAAFLYGGV